MLQEQILSYIRENAVMVAVVSGGIGLFLLLIMLVQVSGMRREIRKICKKIRQYFDVVLADTPIEEAQAKEDCPKEAQVQTEACQTAEEIERQNEERKKEEDMKLLMDVISEVF